MFLHFHYLFGSCFLVMAPYRCTLHLRHLENPSCLHLRLEDEDINALRNVGNTAYVYTVPSPGKRNHISMKSRENVEIFNFLYRFQRLASVDCLVPIKISFLFYPSFSPASAFLFIVDHNSKRAFWYGFLPHFLLVPKIYFYSLKMYL
jgi:hypothetical protein